MCRFDSAATERTKSPEDLGFGEKVEVLLGGVVLPKPRNGIDPGNLGLAFETVRFPNGRGQNLESWFIPGGGGLTVVLFHGYGASKEATLPMARVFHEFGCNCLLVDFYGSGGSSGDTTSFGYYEAEDVRAAVNWVQANLEPSGIVLYGISMGGAAVTRACAELGVAPSGLIVESTFANFMKEIVRNGVTFRSIWFVRMISDCLQFV